MVLEEKQKRRVAVAVEVKKCKEVEKQVVDLNKWLDELHDEISVCQSHIQSANKKIKQGHNAKGKSGKPIFQTSGTTKGVQAEA